MNISSFLHIVCLVLTLSPFINNAAEITPSNNELLLVQLIQGLGAIQESVTTLSEDAQPYLPAHLQEQLQALEELVNELQITIERTEKTEPKRSHHNLPTRSADIAHVNREKLTFIAHKVEDMLQRLSHMDEKLGDEITTRNKTLLELEDIDNTDVSILDLLKAIYRKLDLITG